MNTLCILYVLEVPLIFNAGTPIAQIQHYGRWLTLTALIYYRDRLGFVGFNCAMAFGTGRYRGECDY